jgi:hypothetical protein
MSGATRTAEASTTEEPGAGKPHAGICAGGAGNWRPYRDDVEEMRNLQSHPKRVTLLYVLWCSLTWTHAQMSSDRNDDERRSTFATFP